MITLFSRKTQYHIAFSIAEQGLACLSALYKQVGFDISSAEIRNSRSLQSCKFDCLPTLSLELGFKLDKINLNSMENIMTLKKPAIINTRQLGVVILDGCKKDYVWLNNPSKGWMKIQINNVLSLLREEHGYILSDQKRGFLPKRKKAQFITAMLTSDKAFLALAVLIIFISLLHGISSLLDPVMKNIYFTNVVQMSMIDWARPIAIFYFLSAVFSGLLLLISSVLAALLTNRMALRWSFSVFSSLLRLPNEYMRIRAHGDLMGRVRASEMLASFIGSQEVMLLGSLLNFLILIWVLLSISPLLSLLLITFQLFAICIVFATNAGRKERSDQLHYHSASETSSFVRLFGNINGLLSLRRELQAFRFHILTVSQRIRSQQKLSVFTSLVSFSTTIIDQVQSTILLLVAAFLIIDGQINLGQYIGFSAMLSLVISPMKRFSQFIGSWQTMQTIHERILDVCEEASLSATKWIKQAQNNEILYWSISNISKINPPQDHDFSPVRIDYSSANNVLLVNSNQHLKQVESFLSGEDIIPPVFNIKVAYRDGVKKMLIARTSPYVYQKDLRSNVLLYTESELENLGFTIEMIINQLKFDLSAEFTTADMQSLNKRQLYQLGILRVLWQKPDAMIIVSTNEYGREEQDDFHKKLQMLCSRLSIYLVLLTDSEYVNTQIWGDHNSLSPFLELVTEA